MMWVTWRLFSSKFADLHLRGVSHSVVQPIGGISDIYYKPYVSKEEHSREAAQPDHENAESLKVGRTEKGEEVD